MEASLKAFLHCHRVLDCANEAASSAPAPQILSFHSAQAAPKPTLTRSQRIVRPGIGSVANENAVGSAVFMIEFGEFALLVPKGLQHSFNREPSHLCRMK